VLLLLPTLLLPDLLGPRLTTLVTTGQLQKPLLDQVPQLKVVMEHITTADAAAFVASAPANIAATITPQHMLLNRNALFAVSGTEWCQACTPLVTI
jgi:dihydroorotase